MIELLKDIKEKLNAGVYKNEEQIRLTLVARVLQALGWNIWNPEEVFPEFVVVPKEDSTRVDVALFLTPQFPTVFIEVKAHKLLMNKLAQVEMQVRDYNRNNTAAFSVLTDGQFWRFYFSQTGGEFAQKCFQDFDLLEVDLDDAVTIFQAFLSRSAHQSGSATQEANEMLQLTQKQKHILGLREEAKKLTEVAPYPNLLTALKQLAATKGIVATVEEIEDILEGKATKPRQAAFASPLPHDLNAFTATPNKETSEKEFVATEVDYILLPHEPIDLKHSEVKQANFGSTTAKNWNQLAQTAIRYAFQQQASLDFVRKFANVIEGSKTDTGFKPIEGTPWSSQFMNAKNSWKVALGLAMHFKVSVSAKFLWLNNEGALHRGKTGLLKWSPE